MSQKCPNCTRGDCMHRNGEMCDAWICASGLIPKEALPEEVRERHGEAMGFSDLIGILGAGAAQGIKFE